jgi:hypothetical protein
MRFPIVFVCAAEADEYFKHLIAYKTLYETRFKYDDSLTEMNEENEVGNDAEGQ